MSEPKKFKARWQKIYPLLHHHTDFYDHPLSGVAVINGDWWGFDWEYNSGWMTIHKMSKRDAWYRWYAHMKFGIMVGWHSTYYKGMRTYGNRKPKWFFRRLSASFYRGFWKGFTNPDERKFK